MDETFHGRDRSDERENINAFYEPVNWTSLQECGGKKYGGLSCHGAGLPNDCLPYSAWCSNDKVMPCTELGGRTSVHWDVCSNATLWSGRTFRTGIMRGSDVVHATLASATILTQRIPSCQQHARTEATILTPKDQPAPVTASGARRTGRMSALITISSVTSTLTVTVERMRWTARMSTRRRS